MDLSDYNLDSTSSPNVIEMLLFVPFNEHVWSAGVDGSICIWEVVHGTDLMFQKTIDPYRDENIIPENSILTLMCSITTTNGRQSIWVVVESLNCTICIYNISGILNHTLVVPPPVTAIIHFKDLIWLSSDYSIYLYNPEDLQLLVTWKAHQSTIRAMINVYNTVWTGDATGNIQVWDYLDGSINHLCTLTAHSGFSISAICALPNNRAASAAGTNIIIWDTLKLIPLQEIIIHKRPIINLGLTCLDNFLISVDPTSIKILESQKETFLKKANSETGIKIPIKHPSDTTLDTSSLAGLSNETIPRRRPPPTRANVTISHPVSSPTAVAALRARSSITQSDSMVPWRRSNNSNPNLAGSSPSTLLGAKRTTTSSRYS